VSEEVYKPRSVIIDQIELTNFDKSKTIDIRAMLIALDVYEDMFQSQITGDITIEDSLELIQFFPIVGEETLTLRWRIPTASEDRAIVIKDLRIYKIGDRAGDGNMSAKSQKYKLYFMSGESSTNLNIAVSRSFTMKKASDIAKLVYDDYIKKDKPFEFHETQGLLRMIIPNWKPFKIMNWLATDKAINIEGLSDFIFYESTDKINGPKYNFKSLSILMKQPPTFTINFNPQNVAENSPGVDTKIDMVSSANNIEGFTFGKTGDVAGNTMNGMYNQSWIIHDPLRKKFVVKKPIHKEDYWKPSPLGSNRFYTDKLQEETKPLQFFRMPGAVNNFPVEIDADRGISNNMNKIAEPRPRRLDFGYIAKRETPLELQCDSMMRHLYKRAFELQKNNNFIASISSIPGNDRIQLGGIIEFNKPHLSYNNDMYNEQSGRLDDRYISGNFLVTRLSHNFRATAGDGETRYTMSLDLMKDNFIEQISHKTIAE